MTNLLRFPLDRTTNEPTQLSGPPCDHYVTKSASHPEYGGLVKYCGSCGEILYSSFRESSEAILKEAKGHDRIAASGNGL